MGLSSALAAQQGGAAGAPPPGQYPQQYQPHQQMPPAAGQGWLGAPPAQPYGECAQYTCEGGVTTVALSLLPSQWNAVRRACKLQGKGMEQSACPAGIVPCTLATLALHPLPCPLTPPPTQAMARHPKPSRTAAPRPQEQRKPSSSSPQAAWLVLLPPSCRRLWVSTSLGPSTPLTGWRPSHSA